MSAPWDLASPTRKRELKVQLTTISRDNLTEFVNNHIRNLMSQAINIKIGNVVYYGVLCHKSSWMNREIQVGLVCSKHRLIPGFASRLLDAKECEDLDIPTSWGMIDAPEEKPIPTRFQRAWVI